MRAAVVVAVVGLAMATGTQVGDGLPGGLGVVDGGKETRDRCT